MPNVEDKLSPAPAQMPKGGVIRKAPRAPDSLPTLFISPPRLQLAAAALVAAGFADFQLIAYHFQKAAAVQAAGGWVVDLQVQTTREMRRNCAMR